MKIYKLSTKKRKTASKKKYFWERSSPWIFIKNIPQVKKYTFGNTVDRIRYNSKQPTCHSIASSNLIKFPWQ
jgi:hypothetical protein